MYELLAGRLPCYFDPVLVLLRP